MLADFTPMLADRGHAITGAVPGIGALAAFDRRLVLDGELVAGAGTADDFHGLLPHRARRRHPGPPAPVSFCPLCRPTAAKRLHHSWSSRAKPRTPHQPGIDEAE